MTLLSALLSGKSHLQPRLLQVYKEYLYEEAYLPHVVKARRDEIRKAVKEKLVQAKLLEKVAKLGGNPAKTPAPKKKSQRGGSGR